MATLLEITNGRKEDSNIKLKNLGFMKVINAAGTFTLRNSNGSTATIRLFNDAGNSKQALQMKAVRDGLELVRGRGFAVPDISIYLSTSPSVQCVATMGNSAGAAEYNIFMGPKTGVHTPQVKDPTSPFQGGSGPLSGPKASSTGRGVADQVYDGTQRWFGNPKMLAHATIVVVHELGHVMHEVQHPDVFWDNKGRPGTNTVPPGTFMTAACKISQYAGSSTTSLEFVAETFAGTIAGKTYDQQVKTAYAACSGPVPGGSWL